MEREGIEINKWKPQHGLQHTTTLVHHDQRPTTLTANVRVNLKLFMKLCVSRRVCYLHLDCNTFVRLKSPGWWRVEKKV